MKREWLGQVRWDGLPWEPSGRFDHEPTEDELRNKAYNVMGVKSRGTPDPIQVRVVTVTYEPGPPVAFREKVPA